MSWFVYSEPFFKCLSYAGVKDFKAALVISCCLPDLDSKQTPFFSFWYTCSGNSSASSKGLFYNHAFASKVGNIKQKKQRNYFFRVQ